MPAGVHRFRSGIGDAVNGYLVELDDAVVAVDSSLGLAAGRRLRSRLDRLGKPLAAVLVTHGHFDHVSGLAALTAGTDVPIISTAAVAARLPEEYATGHERFGAQLGDDWVPDVPPVNTTLADGESLAIAGTSVQLIDLGLGGDSAAGAAFALDALPGWLFVGDLVYHEVHPLQLDGGVLAWLANLDRVRRGLPDGTSLLVGHGDPAGLELFDLQRDYLLEYAGHVRDLVGKDGRLTAPAREELVARVTGPRPGWGLELFVAMSADAVARELLAPTRAA